MFNVQEKCSKQGEEKRKELEAEHRKKLAGRGQTVNDEVGGAKTREKEDDEEQQNKWQQQHCEFAIKTEGAIHKNIDKLQKYYESTVIDLCPMPLQALFSNVSFPPLVSLNILFLYFSCLCFSGCLLFCFSFHSTP